MSRTALEIMLDPSDRAALERLARSPHTPQSLANRARIVLAAAEGLSNQQIAERLHVSIVTVGKWRSGLYPCGGSWLSRSAPSRMPAYEQLYPEQTPASS